MQDSIPCSPTGYLASGLTTMVFRPHFNPISTITCLPIGTRIFQFHRLRLQLPPHLRQFWIQSYILAGCKWLNLVGVAIVSLLLSSPPSSRPNFLLLIARFFHYFHLGEDALLFVRKSSRRSCRLPMMNVFVMALLIQPGKDMHEVSVIRLQVTNGAFIQLPTSLTTMSMSIRGFMVMSRQSISPNQAFRTIILGQFGDGFGRGHFVYVQHRDEMQDVVPVEDLVNRPCTVCQGTHDHAHTFICEYCNSACHIWCTKPRLSEIPPLETNWYCNECVFNLKDPAHFDITHEERVREYRRWLHLNSLPDFVGRRDIFIDGRSRRSGVIIYPKWEDITNWWHDCWRRELWTDNNLPSLLSLIRNRHHTFFALTIMAAPMFFLMIRPLPSSTLMVVWNVSLIHRLPFIAFL